MRVGLFTDGLAHLRLGEALDWLAAELPGVRDLEIGTGGFSLAPHCDLAALLGDARAQQAWLDEFEGRGFRVAALGCLGLTKVIVAPAELDQRDRQ